MFDWLPLAYELGIIEGETVPLDVLADERDEWEPWTWLDSDPDVAINDPESWHGRVLALAIDYGGWERCYHSDGASLHLKVKLYGQSATFAKAMERMREERPLADHDDIELLATTINDGSLYWWWEGLAPDSPAEYLHERGYKGAAVYQCGRMGGYANCSALETDPRAMVLLGWWLQGQREYYNGQEWADCVVADALREYDEAGLTALESARPERVEA